MATHAEECPRRPLVIQELNDKLEMGREEKANWQSRVNKNYLLIYTRSHEFFLEESRSRGPRSHISLFIVSQAGFL